MPGSAFFAACIYTIILVTLSSGCGNAVKRMEQQAQTAGFRQLILTGDGFLHASYTNDANSGSSRLHVYIEGDGMPWLTRTRIATEPTSRHALILKLMMMDPEAALYLGRPCYNGMVDDRGCNPLVWTYQRYSQVVVDSMASALASYLKQGPERELVFIGHSGGGTLAMLLAARFTNTRAVVTIAGNLDTETWSDYHDYDPLSGSINPAESNALGSHIRQIHYTGTEDRNIRPEFIEPVISRQENASLTIIPGFDHQCCWQSIWPDVLRQINTL